VAREQTKKMREETMNRKRSYSVFGLVSVLFLTMGCGGGLRNFLGMSAVKVPPGVSPIVAARADSIAAGLFVSLDDERKATALAEQGIQHYNVSDSLWAVIDAAKKAAVPRATAEDSVNAVKEAVTGALKLQEGAQNIQSYDRTQEQKLIIQASYNLKEAQKHLEKSVQLNPFNTQVQNYLAITYKLLAQRFPQEMTYDKALRLWGTLARLEPGEYNHYYNLGDTYLKQQNWRDALGNFKKAEEILLASAEVSPQRVANPSLPVEATLDTTNLVYSVYYQAQCAIKLFDAEQALRHLHRAKQLTSSPDLLAAFDSYIDWINWDDGNILGSVMRDSAAALASRAEFVEAAKIYNDLINNLLKTKRTKDQMSWTYAGIEYQQLNRKASAVARLYEVVQSIPKSVNGAPLDSTYKTYFDAYGTMCYNLGIDTLRSDRKLAYTYLSQAAEVEWSKRGKAYMAMADLSRANPEMLVENGEKAAALAEHLEPDELLNLYKLLVDGYRRLRQMDKAKVYFEKVRAMQ
jgi:tetratricopeptide (TPR) repeat protein